MVDRGKAYPGTYWTRKCLGMSCPLGAYQGPLSLTPLGEGRENMTEKPLNFGAIPKFDEYVPVELPILGQKEVTRKSDGKRYQVLICRDEKGREVSLFDWALCEREGRAYVLKKALRTALDTAK